MSIWPPWATTSHLRPHMRDGLFRMVSPYVWWNLLISQYCPSKADIYTWAHWHRSLKIMSTWPLVGDHLALTTILGGGLFREVSLCTACNLLLSQYCPVKPVRQLHINPLTPATHVPPFLHGLLLHRSLSGKELTDLFLSNLLQHQKFLQSIYDRHSISSP